MKKLTRTVKLVGGLTAVLLGAVGVGTVAAGCSGGPSTTGAIVLAFQTDMAPPKDVDKIRIIVKVRGETRFDATYIAGEGGMLLPATLGVVSGAEQAAPVGVHVVAFQKGKPGVDQVEHAQVVSEITTTVPRNRVALLRIPIQWLCFGQATTTPGSVGEVADGTSNKCDANQSCFAGTCASSNIPEESLPNYADAVVFGGGDSVGKGGSCFDTVACFASGSEVKVDMKTCSIDTPLPFTNANVGLVLPKLSSLSRGICSRDACFVPLDANSSLYGWTLNASGRVSLPPAICTRLGASDPAILGVAVATACPSKGEAVPTCGPWSSVHGGTDGSSTATPGNLHTVVDGGSGDSGGSAADARSDARGTGNGAEGGIDGGTVADASNSADATGSLSCGALSGNVACDTCITNNCCGLSVSCQSNPLCFKAGICALQCALSGVDCTSDCETTYSPVDLTFSTVNACLQGMCKAECFPKGKRGIDGGFDASLLDAGGD